LVQLFAIALRLKPEVDVSGIATALLACVTVYLARSTQNTAKATHRAAQAAQETADVARKQLNYAQRPVVAPRITAEPPATGPAGDPVRARLEVPLRNIGVGPALEVVISIQVHSSTRQQDRVEQPALAVGADIAGYLETHGAPSAPVFALQVTYRDVSDQRYETTGRWNPDEHRYDDLKIREIPRA
jgi:hypothetical protein